MRNLLDRGFTLVEILVAATVATVAGVLLIQLWINSNGVFYSQTTTVDQGLKTNNTSATIQQDLKSAASVAASYLSFETSSSVLVLKIPSIDANNNVIDQTYDYLVIAKDNSTPKILRRQIFPNAQSTRAVVNNVLLTNLKAITFSYLDKNGNQASPTSASKINYLINVENQLGMDTKVASISGEVSLRND